MIIKSTYRYEIRLSAQLLSMCIRAEEPGRDAEQPEGSVESHDAKRVLSNALRVAGAKPVRIITDGLAQYVRAIKKVIAWPWQEYRSRHIVDSGIGKNALIERLNREVKRRLKWFSTFQSLKGARTFFGLWFSHYNERRSAHAT